MTEQQQGRMGCLAVFLLVGVIALIGNALGGDDESDNNRRGSNSPMREQENGIADPLYSPRQYEQAREIGYSICASVGSERAKLDPVGYAERRFGGAEEFDASRVQGCIDALTD